MTHIYTCCECAEMPEVKYDTMTFHAQAFLVINGAKFKETSPQNYQTTYSMRSH